MRTQGIGEMILRLRIEKRLSQSELGRKIYNKREISRIEMEEIVPDVFALDYLLREEIIDAISSGKEELAEKKIEEYENLIVKNDILHWQYIDFLRASLCWEKEDCKEECIAYIERGIKKTLDIVVEEESFWEQPMSWEEIMLLVLWVECRKKGTDFIELMERILEYVEKHWEDVEEKAKIYPYTAFRLSKIFVKELRWKEAEKYCDKAIELLRKTGSLCGLLDLLQLQSAIKKELYGECEIIVLKEQIAALKRVYEEYGYYDRTMGILTRIRKEFYLDSEVIRKNRIANGYT